jgi:hypothetical protein
VAIITAAHKKEAAERLALAEKVSRRWRISVADVARIAKAIAQSEIDPLYTIHGHELVVPPYEPKKYTARYEWDMEYLSIAPDPFEHCNILEMLNRYETDSQNGYSLMKRNSDNDARVIGNQLAWARFLAVRHPHPLMREWFEGYGEAITSGTVVQYTKDFLVRCEAMGFDVSFDDKGAPVSLRRI